VSTSSYSRGSTVEQLVFCEKRIQELEELNDHLISTLTEIQTLGQSTHHARGYTLGTMAQTALENSG